MPDAFREGEGAPARTVDAPPPLGALVGLAWRARARLGASALLMGISALATAGYAFLIGPVVRSLFLGPAPAAPIAPAGAALGRLASALGAASPAVLGGFIVAAAAVKGAAYFGYTALSARAGQEILHALRARLFQGLLAANPLSKTVSARGDLVTRFTVDAEAVERSISTGLLTALRGGLEILALAGLALALDPVLGAVGLVAFPPIAYLIIRLGRRLRSRQAAWHAAYGDMGREVDETVSGLPVIQSFGAERLLSDRFDARSRRIGASFVRAALVKAVSSPANELLGAGALALTLFYARGRIESGALSPESFISFFSALLLLYQPVKEIGQAQHALQSGLAALARLLPFGAGRPAVPSSDPDRGAAAVAQGPVRAGEVRLAGVEAGYGEGPSILRNLDLTIASGQRLAVVGRSGAGKSTLINLLRGFLPLRGGRLLVDGAPLDLDLHTARRLFAPVPQEPFLFDDTIYMNVLCGRPDATRGEVEAACAAAGVDLFASERPGGLEAPVGSGGAALSVGQRQRVCLARALLTRAPILLLDEATASLDGETEQTLTEGLGRFLDGRTVVAITHRLSTALWADQVALLEAGAIAYRGPSDRLRDPDSPLRRLFGDQAPRRT